MIEEIYSKELEELNIVFNSQNVLVKTTRKLINDLNSQHFFKELIENIKKYDDLNNVELYRFKDDVKSMYKILIHLYLNLKKEKLTSEENYENMIKSCRVFPDFIGRDMIKLISYLPILKLIKTKIEYEEYIEQKLDLNDKITISYMEEQQERLFGEDSIVSNKFLEDEEFKDFKMKNDYVNKIEKEYNLIKKDLNSCIKHLIELYEKVEDLEEFKIIIGSVQWEKNQSLKTDLLSLKVIEEILKMVKTYNDKKTNILKEIYDLLTEKLKMVVPNHKELIIEYKNKKSIFTFKNDDVLTKEMIKEIEKIIIIKSKKEIYHIKNDLLKTHQNIDSKIWSYSFECYISFN